MNIRRVWIIFTAILLLARIPALAMSPLDHSSPFSDKNPLPLGWPSHMILQTGPLGGPWSVLGSVIAEELSRATIPTASRLGKGLLNAEDVSAGTVDLAFSLTCVYTAKMSGEPEYAHLNIKDVVMVSPVYPEVLYFVVQKKFAEKHAISEVDSLLGLKEPVRFTSLKPGTASDFMLSLLLRHGYDIDLQSLRAENGWAHQYADYAEAADNFVNNEIDCMTFMAGADAVILRELEQLSELVVLSIRAEVLEKLEKKFNTGMHTISPGVYTSIQSPVQTMSSYSALVVNENMQDSLAFAIARAIWFNQQSIERKSHDTLVLVDPRTLGVPLHPGALSFWESLPTSAISSTP